MFLQETEASIAVFDLRGFSKMAAELTPVDLGTVLGHFYTYAEDLVLGHGGRVIKFAGDAVIAVWLRHEIDQHQKRALQCVAAAASGKGAWIETNRASQMAPLDYSVAAASGPVLAGHIGTERLKSFDVLGDAVNVAAKLTTVATVRGYDHIVTFRHPDLPLHEVEGIELGGRHLRLYRLD